MLRVSLCGSGLSIEMRNYGIVSSLRNRRIDFGNKIDSSQQVVEAILGTMIWDVIRQRFFRKCWTEIDDFRNSLGKFLQSRESRNDISRIGYHCRNNGCLLLRGFRLGPV